MGGPTNGRADACRRRLAAVELATPLHRNGGFPPGAGFSPNSPALSPPTSPLTSCHLQPLFIVLSCATAGPSAPIICSIPIHLLRCTTITPAAASTDLSLPSRPTATGTTSRAPTMCPAWVETPLHCSRQLGRPSAAATGPSPSQAPSAAIPIHLSRSLLVAQSCRPGGRGWATARP